MFTHISAGPHDGTQFNCLFQMVDNNATFDFCSLAQWKYNNLTVRICLQFFFYFGVSALTMVSRIQFILLVDDAYSTDIVSFVTVF